MLSTQAAEQDVSRGFGCSKVPNDWCPHAASVEQLLSFCKAERAVPIATEFDEQVDPIELGDLRENYPFGPLDVHLDKVERTAAQTPKLSSGHNFNVGGPDVRYSVSDHAPGSILLEGAPLPTSARHEP